MEHRFSACDDNIRPITEAILTDLRSLGISEKLCKEYELVIEELIVKLVGCATESDDITVLVNRRLGRTTAKITCPGQPVLFESESYSDYSGKILSEFSEHLKQSYAYGVNEIIFSTSSSSDSILTKNLISLLLAVVIGVLLKLFCPEPAFLWFNEHIISPVASVYIRVLQTVAAPVAFVSLAYFVLTVRRTFSHSDHMGSLAVRYLISSVVSIGLSLAVCQLFLPVIERFDFSQYAVGENNFMGTTVREFLEQTFPSNLIAPFLGSNPIPLLINALLLGFAAGGLFGKSSETVNNLLASINDLFAQMLGLIYNTIPVFLFFAVLDIINRVGFEALRFLGWELLSAVVAVLCLFVYYALRLLLSGIHPIRFIKENKELISENFKIASNIDAFPYNKRMLARKTKLTRTFLDKGLRLGTLLNMDGNCLYVTLFIAQTIISVHMELSFELILGIAVILLLFSVGAPNQPGSLLLGMVLLMSFVGISVELLSTVLVLEALTSKFYSFLNALGDLVTVFAADQRQKTKNKTAA